MNIIRVINKTVTSRPLGSRVRIYALLCAAIAATGSMARGDWTQFRFDPTHHGVAPDETILSPANVANLTVKWRTDIGGGCFASATVVDGKLYTADTGSADGKLHALDIATGQELWTFPPDALAGDSRLDDAGGSERHSLFRREPPHPGGLRRRCRHRAGDLGARRHNIQHRLFAGSTRRPPAMWRSLTAPSDHWTPQTDRSSGASYTQAVLIPRRQSPTDACISQSTTGGCLLSTPIPAPNCGWLRCLGRNGPRPLWITDGSSSARVMTTSCTPSTR